MRYFETLGQFTDTPPEARWWCRFDVLFLPEQHRKILNRQPEMKTLHGWIVAYISYMFLTDWNIDWKVISN